jgi:importin subunit alpha-6/7
MVLQAGALPPMLRLLTPEANSSQSLLRNATWTLSNFCRGKPPPDFECTRQALPTLHELLLQSSDREDDEVLTDACWALSYLSDGPNDRIQAVAQANVIPRLIELLRCRREIVLVPALRTVGNIVTGTDEQTQAVVECNALQVRFQSGASWATCTTVGWRMVTTFKVRR